MSSLLRISNAAFKVHKFTFEAVKFFSFFPFLLASFYFYPIPFLLKYYIVV